MVYKYSLSLFSIIIIFFSCKNSIEPEAEAFSIIQSSISDGDSVQVDSELFIQFSSAVNIETFFADSIVSEMIICYDVNPGETPDSDTLSLTVIKVDSSRNITLNNRPQLLWYDPNTHSCAFIKVTTISQPEGIFQPDGTGEGFF